MKELSYILLMVFAGVFLIACEDDLEKAVLSSNPTPPSITAPASPSGINLVKENAANAVTFSWSAADFGFPASVTYGVQFSPYDNFSEKATLFTSQKLTSSVKIGEINGVLLALGYPVGESGTVKARMFATVGAGTDSAFSATTSFTVTPYEELIDYPMIYVPGSYQGWSPGAVNGRLFSYGFNAKYENIIRLVDGANANVEFKITPQPNWNSDWGGSLTATANGYNGALASGSNFQAAAGTYKFEVDTDAKTIKLTKTDDWGIIGSSIPPYDWSADVDMFYNGQRKVWEVTGDFKAGEFKFRANDAWTLDYGDTGGDGSINAGGTNIPLATDGNYTIRLDFINNTYKVIKN